MLLGDPGFGKTSVVARLSARRPDIVLGVHLCDHADEEKRDARRMVKTLAFQLATKVPDYAKKLREKAAELEEKMKEGLPTTKLVDLLLLQPLCDVPRPTSDGGRALLLIDALDEAEVGQKNELADILSSDKGFARLPPWLGVVVTSRPERPLRAKLNRLRPTELSADADASFSRGRRKDAQLYLEKLLEDCVPPERLKESVEEAASKAKGSFLYLHWLSERVRRDGAKALEALPLDMGGWYEEAFRRVLPSGLPKEYDARCVLEAIVAAPVPLHGKNELPSLSGVKGPRCKKLLDTLSNLFPVRDEGRVHVFHKSCTDWLTGAPPFEERKDEDDPPYLLSVEAAHDRLASACIVVLHGRERLNGSELELEGGDAEAEDEPARARFAYALRWAAHHLAEAGRTDECATLITNLFFIEAKLKETQLVELLSDYRLLLGKIKKGLGRLEAKRSATKRRAAAGVTVDESIGALADDCRRLEGFCRFVSRERPVLEREPDAVYQLAYQQPDSSAPYAGWERAQARLRELYPSVRFIAWKNKPQQAHACLDTLAHPSAVSSIAVSSTHIVGGAGKTIYVYDAARKELVEELDGESDVECVAVFEGDEESGQIAAGYRDGTIKVWDAGAKPPCPAPPDA